MDREWFNSSKHCILSTKYHIPKELDSLILSVNWYHTQQFICCAQIVFWSDVIEQQVNTFVQNPKKIPWNDYQVVPSLQ